MPSITQPQWDAIRRTAFAVARDAAREEWAKVEAKRKKPKDEDRYQCAVTKDWFTYVAGEWRRESQLDFDIRQHLGLGFFEGDKLPNLAQYFGEPCAMNFAPCPPIEYHENSRLGKILRTAKRPDLPRRENTAPVSIPTTGFYMVVDARCYPEGAGPDNAHPWFLYPPKMLHATEDYALKEAERLSTEHGVPFIVLTSVKMVDVKPATTRHTDMKPVSR